MPLILSRAVPAGVVGNIPVRDGMHGRAGDLLLHLDETETRANAQVLAQQLDRARVLLRFLASAAAARRLRQCGFLPPTSLKPDRIG